LLSRVALVKGDRKEDIVVKAEEPPVHHQLPESGSNGHENA
jgi:hypothetical protein